MKITTKAQLQALPIGAEGFDKDGMLIRKVSQSEFMLRSLNSDTWLTYGLDEVAGDYNEGRHSTFLPLDIDHVAGKVQVKFELSLHLPLQDLDLLDKDMLTHALQDRLNDILGRYTPMVERRSKDWEIEAQKRGLRRGGFHEEIPAGS